VPQRAKAHTRETEPSQLVESINGSPTGFSSNNKPAGPTFMRKQEKGKYTKFVNMDATTQSSKSVKIANS